MLEQCFPLRTVIPLRRATLRSRSTVSWNSFSAPANLNTTRCFVNSPALDKKKERQTKAISSVDDNLKASIRSTQVEDPLDLAQLQDRIAATVSRLTDDLSKVRAGSRFHTEMLESLNVKLSKESKDSVKLGDLAQVVPKGGRMVSVLAAEQNQIKPIITAILSSNLSVTPQQDPHNPSQLNLSIPPPTKESRDQTVQLAKHSMERAANVIRDSRGVVHKRLQEAQKKRIARADDVKKTHEKMEKLVERGHKDIKGLFETAKKALEQA